MQTNIHLRVMKLIVQIRLNPTKDQLDALVNTLRTVNAACNHVSDIAFSRKIWRNYDLRAVTYGDVRARFGLQSQLAQSAIKKVADAYGSGDKKHRHGNAHRQFRWNSAIAFDARNMKIFPTERTVAISTIAGRLTGIRMACADWQADMLANNRFGETDLVYRDGAVYLFVSVDVPETECNQARNGFLGVDMGIVNIAATSDGTVYSGTHLNHVRNKNLRLRRKLQQKGTKSAKRLLKKRSGREARFARDVNHCISKKLVTEAERTGRGIAIEDLEGIRARARSRKPQRVALNSWSFHQLGQFTLYKGRRAGVPVIYVDPAYTSQQCSHCGNIDKNNRKQQAKFACTNPDCGLVEHADLNAARNIANRGAQGWAVSHAATRGSDLAA